MEDSAASTRTLPTSAEIVECRAVAVGRSVSTSAVCNLRAQGREATEGNRLSRGTQQPAQTRFRMARRDARQRRCGHASTHLIVDSAVGLSNKLHALPVLQKNLRARRRGSRGAGGERRRGEEAQQAEL